MRLLRVPGLAPLLAGEAVNAIGNWIAIVAIWGFAAFKFDADAGDLALLFVLLSLPGAVLGPALGVAIDRIGPRRSLMIANLAGFVTALALSQATSYRWIIVLALPLGLIEALAAASIDALPPRMVPDDQLVTANALLGGAQDAAIIVGPVLAAGVNAIWGLTGAFIADALTFLVAFAVASRLRVGPVSDRRIAARTDGEAPTDGAHAVGETRLDSGTQVEAAESTSAWGELREGLSLARRTAGLRWTLAISIMVYACFALFGVLEPLYVRDVLAESDSVFAYFQTVFGIGLVGAGLTLARLGDRMATPKTVALAVVASGGAAALYLATTSVAVAYVGVFLWGIDVAFFYIPAKTLLQRYAPTAAHGRVLSINQSLEPLAGVVVTPVVALALGYVGVRTLGVVGGAALTACGIVALVLSRRLTPPPTDREIDPTAGSSRDAIALGGPAPI